MAKPFKNRKTNKQTLDMIKCCFQEKRADVIKELFPFTKFFSNAPQPVFKGVSYEQDLDIAEGCFRHIKKIFTQLEVHV